MVEYPDNFKKPTLIEYLADQVVDAGCGVDDWDTCDLGEKIAIELDLNAKDFQLDDMEYANLIKAMDNFIGEYLSQELETEIAKKAKEGEDNYREYREVIEERN